MSNVIIPIDDFDLEDRESVLIQLRMHFNHGYYFGSQNEPRQHKWWFVAGIVTATIVSNVIWLWAV